MSSLLGIAYRLASSYYAATAFAPLSHQSESTRWWHSYFILRLFLFVLLSAPGVWNVERRAMTMAAGPAGLSDNAMNVVVVRREYKVDGNIALCALLEGRPLEYYHYQYAGRHTASSSSSWSWSCYCYFGTDTPEEKEKRRLTESGKIVWLHPTIISSILSGRSLEYLPPNVVCPQPHRGRWRRRRQEQLEYLLSRAAPAPCSSSVLFLLLDYVE